MNYARGCWKKWKFPFINSIRAGRRRVRSITTNGDNMGFDLYARGWKKTVGITLSGVRTILPHDGSKGRKKTVELALERRYSSSLGSWWWHIEEGAVTGYESIEEGRVKEYVDGGWLACAGTRGLWDKLFVPADEM